MRGGLWGFCFCSSCRRNRRKMRNGELGAITATDHRCAWIVYKPGPIMQWIPAPLVSRLGRSRLAWQCAVCGEKGHVWYDKSEQGGLGELRTDHAHPDRGDPYSWAEPLLSPPALGFVIDLDKLRMRQAADLMAQGVYPPDMNQDGGS